MMRGFHDNAFRTVSAIKNKEYSEFFSDCEIEARLFETKYVRQAVQLYKKESQKC